MQLPVGPPVRPMLARAVPEMPAPDAVEGGVVYEPKWDGFRCVVFRDGDEVELASRNTKPLTRYFPDVVGAVLASTPDRCVLDGEVVLALDGRLDFDRLQDRLHPAASRVRMLAETTPASFVAFDLLALGDESLLDRPFAERRALLEQALADASPPVHLTPLTRDVELARRWFEQFEGAGLDGVIAKPLAGEYRQDARTMSKVKHARTADVVVAGWRPHKTSTPEEPLVGSLLLGLHDDDGALQHVGVAASFTAARRAELVEELTPYETGVDDHPWARWAEAEAEARASGRQPGGQSRWSVGKDLSFTLLRPERVAEVGYEHVEGGRFRHMARFKRWRDDRDAASCTYAQLEEVVGYDLDEVLRS